MAIDLGFSLGHWPLIWWRGHIHTCFDTHIVREKFLAHSFQPESEKESLQKNFAESKTEEHFPKINKDTEANRRGRTMTQVGHDASSRTHDVNSCTGDARGCTSDTGSDARAVRSCWGFSVSFGCTILPGWV